MAKQINIKLAKAIELIESNDDLKHEFAEYLKETNISIDDALTYQEVYIDEYFGFLNNENYSFGKQEGIYQWVKPEGIPPLKEYTEKRYGKLNKGEINAYISRNGGRYV